MGEGGGEFRGEGAEAAFGEGLAVVGDDESPCGDGGELGGGVAGDVGGDRSEAGEFAGVVAQAEEGFDVEVQCDAGAAQPGRCGQPGLGRV